MNDAQRRDMADLRSAAYQRDPQQVQFLTKRLLSQLNFFGALTVALEQVHGFLYLFESYYPDETWVRKMLVSITSFGVAPDDQIAEMALSQSFSAPGCGNFIKAVYDITQSMQKRHTLESRTGYLTSALVNAIMAELVEAWYGNHADAWLFQREHPEDPQAQAVSYEFWTDTETAALDTACWLEVADRLETALLRG